MSNARILVIVAAGMLAIAASTIGCSPAASPSLSPSSSTVTLTVQEQLAETRNGVTAALASYTGGRNNEALEQVIDAYLEHFEFVEAALEAVDAELVEGIEEKLRDELREKVTAGASIEEVSALGNEILGLLDEAATKLE